MGALRLAGMGLDIAAKTADQGAGDRQTKP